VELKQKLYNAIHWDFQYELHPKSSGVSAAVQSTKIRSTDEAFFLTRSK